MDDKQTIALLEEYRSLMDQILKQRMKCAEIEKLLGI